MSDLCKHLPGHSSLKYIDRPLTHRGKENPSPQIVRVCVFRIMWLQGFTPPFKDNHHGSHTSKSKECRELNVEDTQRKKMRKQRAHKKRRAQRLVTYSFHKAQMHPGTRLWRSPLSLSFGDSLHSMQKE